MLLMAKSKIEFNLPVSILKEGSVFVAYSPALDISTVGNSFEEAQRRFEEAVEIFFEEIVENKTLEAALSELGWQRENERMIPPIVVSNQMKSFTLNQTTSAPYAKYLAH